MQTSKCAERITWALVCSAIAITGAYATTSPYAGQEGRAIKALSTTEVADLLAGNGMGFAKAAELNGYPGPSHVLQLSTDLRLSQEQISRTQAIFQRMEAEARALGGELVEAERELDDLFRSRTVTPELLTSRLERIAALQAKVREAHLRAHIEQTGLLSKEQVTHYLRLRGYDGNDGSGGQHGHHH